MFRSKPKQNLSDDMTRRLLADEAIAKARELYAAGEGDDAREPILALQDRFDEAGIDRLELLYLCESALPSDTLWLEAIVEILVRRSQIEEPEIPYLVRQAQRTPARLDLWQRIFREWKRIQRDDKLFEAREVCVQAMSFFFPAPGESRWPDPPIEREAHALFLKCIEECVGMVVRSQRRDERAMQLLKSARSHLGSRPETMPLMSEIIMRLDLADPESIGVVLTCVMEYPDNLAMRRWAARALMRLPSHQSEGFAMLRQLSVEFPRDEEIEGDLVASLRLLDTIAEEDVPRLQRWLKKNPTDLRALELMADYYAAKEDIGEEALKVYRRAAATSSKRRNYLRVMGKAHASRGDWSDVIAVLNEVRAGGQSTEDIILPLATAYAEFDRNDAEAAAIYRKAVEMGTRKEGVHANLCRHLFLTAPTAPDSIAQFAQTLSIFPQNQWANLGMVRHFADTGDFPRALEGALAILAQQPGDLEAVRAAGKAIAADFGHKQLARLASLPPAATRRIFEEAYKLNPDAGPIAMGLARHRLSDKVRDAETAKLLGDVCRKYPDAVDLRMARADILWELGQEENAAALDRDLVNRWRATSGQQLSSRSIVSFDTRRRVLKRLSEWVLKRGPKADDIEILLEACGEPDVQTEMIVATARALVELHADHPQKIAVVTRALQLAPGDMRLERALAEAQAAQGNPKPAIRLAARLIKGGSGDESIGNLLRSSYASLRGTRLEDELVQELRAALHYKLPPPNILLAGMEFISLTGGFTQSDVRMLETLAEKLPRNIRVRRWLAEALKLAGEERRAADLYGSLVDEVQDDELVLELAKTQSRIGQHLPTGYRFAKRACELEPGNMELLFHLGAIQLNMGLHAEAAERFDIVLARQPDMHARVLAALEHKKDLTTDRGSLLLIKARVHCAAGNVEQAILALAKLQPQYQRHLGDLLDCYGHLIRIAPENTRARMERSILFRLAGRLDEAIADLAEAHKIAPDNFDILSEYADTLAQKVNGPPSPDTDEAAARVGELYLLLGEDDLAMQMAQKALEKNEKHEGAHKLLARLQLNTGALDDCWETIQRVGIKGPEILRLLQELARAYDEKGLPLRAAQVLTDAIEHAGPQRALLEQLRALHQQQATADSATQNAIFTSLSNQAQKRYELREEIGSGSMGVVYKAYDSELDEIVALKILPEHFANNEEALGRFRHEAKAARRLSHPNIVRIHDIGEESGRKHISMEYVAGGDLKKYLKMSGGPLAPAEAIRIVREIAKALGHAHSEGLLHRDIKTANILLTPSGRVKLSDFGIAAIFGLGKAAERRSGDTIAGTPLYMSPEQFEGMAMSPASDLYSVGVLLYELLSGAPPFTKGSISYHHQFTQPAKIASIPDALWKVVEKLLRKNPIDRYMNAEELVQALDALAMGNQTPQLDMDIINPPENIGELHTPLASDGRLRPVAHDDYGIGDLNTPLSSDRPETDLPLLDTPRP